MARVRPLDTYPSDLWTIVKGCGEEGKEFIVEVETINKARSLQGKFYSFRQALQRAEGQEAITILAMNTICWIDVVKWKDHPDQPVVVTFCNKDKHPDAVLLRTAKVVETKLDPKQEETAQDLLKRAMEKLNPVVDPTGGKYG